MKVITYERRENGAAIYCCACKSTSYSADAAVQCPLCGMLHEELKYRIERAMRVAWKQENGERSAERLSRRRAAR